MCSIVHSGCLFNMLQTMASGVMVKESELTCALCTKVYEDPRGLPCLHTYCFRCLADYVGSSKTIKCPICSEITPVPTGGMEHTKKNVIADGVVKRYRKQRRQRGQVQKITLTDEGFGVTGIAVMKETLWVVLGAQPFLYAYPLATPNQPQKIALQNLQDPDNITVCHPERSELMISDSGSKSLMTVEVKQLNNTWKLGISRVVHIECTPWGLGYTKGNLLVCDGEAIRIFSLSCKLTGEVNLPQAVKPWKALSRIGSPGYVVRDGYNKQICLLNENGEVDHIYRGKNGIQPGDIACYGHSIYITDQKNNNVQELNKHGGYVRAVIGEKEGLRNPGRLCVDEKGILYVAHDAGKGQVEVLATELG